MLTCKLSTIWQLYVSCCCDIHYIASLKHHWIISQLGSSESTWYSLQLLLVSNFSPTEIEVGQEATRHASYMNCSALNQSLYTNQSDMTVVLYESLSLAFLPPLFLALTEWREGNSRALWDWPGWFSDPWIWTWERVMLPFAVTIPAVIPQFHYF